MLQLAQPLDLQAIKQNLALITARGHDRGQNLDAKLASLLAETGTG